MEGLKLRNEKNLENCIDVSNRIERLCRDLEVKEEWSLQTEAEAIKKMLGDIFYVYGLEL